MADIDELDVEIEELPDETVDEVEDDEADDSPEENAADASLEDLYDAEVVKDQQQVEGPIEDEDELMAKVMEAPDEEPSETLSFRVSGRADDEFQCQSCFLIKKPSQLADPKHMVCIDCA